jgi:hypothetical protein
MAELLPGAFARRVSAASVITVLALTGPGCESQPAARVSNSASPDAGTGDSRSTSPTSDLQVQVFRIASRDKLLRRLGDLGWEEIVVFPNGNPKRVEIWGGDDHWHAQTHYVSAGTPIEVTQAGIGGLPPGRLVRIRGEQGIRSQGGPYWIERDFVVAFSPGEKELAARLEWVSVAT